MHGRRRGSPGGPGGRGFWVLWTAGAVSSLGDGVDLAALPLLASTLTRDPRLIGGLTTATSLPWLGLALVSGAIADRVDRRRLMAGVDAVRAVVLAGLAVTVLTANTTIWLLYAVGFLLGTGQTLFDNAAQALLPAVVGPNGLEVANGRLYSVQTIGASFAGPPLGGVLFVAVVSLPFWADSGSFLASALLIVTLRGTFRGRPAGSTATLTSLRHDIAEGVRWLWRHQLLRTLAALLGAINFGFALGYGTLVLYAKTRLGLSSTGFGLLLAAEAVGAVTGGLLAQRIIRLLGPVLTLVAAIGVMAAGNTAVGAFDNAWAVGAALALSGLAAIVWNVLTVSLRQRLVPDHLRGRVNSVYRTVGWGANPLGSLTGGFLASGFGLRVPWITGGAVIVVAGAALLPIIRPAWPPNPDPTWPAAP